MRRKKRVIIALLTATIATMTAVPVFAAAPPDGKTDASSTPAAANGAWEAWMEQWEEKKGDWTIVSLSPGTNETEMNFSWYSESPNAVLTVSQNEDMSQPLQQIPIQGQAGPVKVEDGVETNYYVCQTTVKDLVPGTYYYQVDQREVESFTVRDSQDAFSFIFIGDPQIGSSNELKGTDTEEFYQAQSDAVRNDSFNWNHTLNQALAKSPNASFVVSAGDQIQTTKKKAPNESVANSEIEYTGYLLPEALTSLPVATTVGNHDADNPNYTYHFNVPNESELGSNGIAGGDYYYTYGDALFIMLNTQDTNAAEHKKFIEETVAANPDKTWRIVTLHQDIYGSGEHSNEPEITNLRYTLVPYFEQYDIDVVLTGHDHIYSRSEILQGGKKTVEYTDEQFEEQLDKDMDAGENPEGRYIAVANIKDDTTDPDERAYLDYLKAVMDEDAIEQVNTDGQAVVNPEGILYMTANSSSGSKYYDLVPRMQSYIAARWQEDVPTYSVVDITDESFTITTYRTDNNEKIDDSFTILKTAEEQQTPTVSYSTHVQNKGWQEFVQNGETSGATEENLRIEAVKMNLEGLDVDGTIQYRTHVQNEGWQEFVSSDAVSGTTGKNLRVEAMQIQLTGTAAEQYDVYYRSYVEGIGWLDWASNGATSGSVGFSKRITGLQVQLVKKGEQAPGETANPYLKTPTISYRAHVQNIGWMDWRQSGIVGTTGQSLRFEAFHIMLDSMFTGDVEYYAHVQNQGWQSVKKNGEVAGTTGANLRLEAVRMNLTGEIAEQYNISYRVHVQNEGWTKWSSNGEVAGTVGKCLRLEAMDIRLEKK